MDHTHRETRVSLVMSLAYRHLSTKDALCQRRLLTLSRNIRIVILKDIKIIWKERFEKISGMRLRDDIVVDWALACRLASEKIQSLWLLGVPEISDQVTAITKQTLCVGTQAHSLHVDMMIILGQALTPSTACSWLDNAIRNKHVNTVKELIKAPCIAGTNINWAVVLAIKEESLGALSCLLDVTDVPSVISTAVSHTKSLKVVLSHPKYKSSIESSSIFLAVITRNAGSLSLVLKHPSKNFGDYYMVAMMAATQIHRNHHDKSIVKMLLSDPKGRGIERNYSDFVPDMRKSLAKLIAIYEDVIISEDTMLAIDKKFGVGSVEKWRASAEIHTKKRSNRTLR